MSSDLDATVLSLRPAKRRLDPSRPYAFLVEEERAPNGKIEPVATLFLTNRECPFRCTMCDLWRHTLDDPVPLGAIPSQIDYALRRLPTARHIKLYNSGSFFDPLAIPPEDYEPIARRLDSFQTVIVENHPKLCGERLLRFRDELTGELEVALGLETAHQQILSQLNKRMTVEDYCEAATWLQQHGIAVRTFVLLKPPGLDEEEAIAWAVRSVECAVAAGSRCVAVIPTRLGNGYLDQLHREGKFAPPRLTSLERVLERCLPCSSVRIFADLWDLEQFSDCATCFPRRRHRLETMNRRQEVPPRVACPDCEQA